MTILGILFEPLLLDLPHVTLHRVLGITFNPYDFYEARLARFQLNFGKVSDLLILQTISQVLIIRARGNIPTTAAAYADGAPSIND